MNTFQLPQTAWRSSFKGSEEANESLKVAPQFQVLDQLMSSSVPSKVSKEGGRAAGEVGTHGGAGR